jgi:phosphatidylinositol alpha-mannosyltransferase
MKIALVSTYDFAYPGGVNHHIYNLDRQLTLMGHDVKIIAPASGQVKNFGERFIRIGTPRPVPSNGSIARVALSPMLSSRVKEVLAEEKFDVIHLHEPLIPMLCTTILRFSRTVNVGTFHAYASKPSYGWTRPFLKYFLKKWFRRLNGRIAVSNAAMAYTNKHFPGQYEIIPNGVDIKHFCPDVEPIESLCDGKRNILFVGRLEKRKGAGYLLKAYKTVKREVPDARLVFVGPSTRLTRKYEKKVARDGLKDVMFIGQVPYRELPRYYKSADVFCAPATGRESFGIVLLEAMAVGKPIVASNIPGYAGVVMDKEEAVLVPPKDVSSLADSLIRVLKDKELQQYMGKCGLEKVQKYSWKSVALQVLDYYEKARTDFSLRLNR